MFWQMRRKAVARMEFEKRQQKRLNAEKATS
jgi:hypothetical protein